MTDENIKEFIGHFYFESSDLRGAFEDAINRLVANSRTFRILLLAINDLNPRMTDVFDKGKDNYYQHKGELIPNPILAWSPNFVLAHKSTDKVLFPVEINLAHELGHLYQQYTGFVDFIKEDIFGFSDSKRFPKEVNFKHWKLMVEHDVIYNLEHRIADDYNNAGIDMGYRYFYYYKRYFNLFTSPLPTTDYHKIKNN